METLAKERRLAVPGWLPESWRRFRFPTATPTLEFKHDEILAFTPISNSFSKKARTDPNHPSAWNNYWFGMLVQLGKFGSTAHNRAFEAVVFYRGESEVGVLTKKDFLWLNVVAARSGMEDPMLPEEALKLLPLPGSPACPNVAFERAIHHNMLEISNVVTIWQGDRGHSWRLAPDVTDQRGPFTLKRSRFVVHVRDPFRITAWRLKPHQPGGLEQVAIGNQSDIQAHQVDRIVFEDAPASGGGGSDIRQDPPWP